MNSVVHNNNFLGILNAGDTFVVDGSLYEDSTLTTGTSFSAPSSNIGFDVNNGTLTIGNGGVAVLDSVVTGKGSGGTGTGTLNINGGSLTVRYNSNGINFIAQGLTKNYTSAITENNSNTTGRSNSTVVNNSALDVGNYDVGENTTSSTIYQGVTTVQIGNGNTGVGISDSWTQNGATSLGNGMVGIMQVDATGTFNSHDFYLGGGPIAPGGGTAAVDLYGSTLSTNSGAADAVTFDGSTYTFSKLTGAGYLVLNGGTMNVTNSTGGTTFTAGAVSTGGSGGVGIVASAAAGGQPYSGERLIFTNLSGTGALQTGVVYYVVNGPNNVNNEFDVSLTPGGAVIALTGFYRRQLPDTSFRAFHRSSISTGTGTVVLPGNLTINSGTMTVDELDTNNTASGSGLENGQSAASSITFNGGTLIVGSSNPTYTYASSAGAPSNGAIEQPDGGQRHKPGGAAVRQRHGWHESGG